MDARSTASPGSRPWPGTCAATTPTSWPGPASRGACHPRRSPSCTRPTTPRRTRRSSRRTSGRPASAAGVTRSAVPSALRRHRRPDRRGPLPQRHPADERLTSEGANRPTRRSQQALDAVPQLLGRGEGLGSNSWVVSGDRTTTGKPLLANDPHLGVGQPGIWIQNSLHCRTVSASCPLDVSGFSFAGVPGVIIGHNGQIAWGFTNLGPDVTDFYLERIVGQTYLRDGQWDEVTTREETIRIRGGADQRILVRSTVHGPVMSDVLEAAGDAGSRAPTQQEGDESESYAVSLAWTAPDAEPHRRRHPRPQPRDELRASSARQPRLFAVPAQNLVYADREGHIGYQAPGQVPIRRSSIPRAPAGYWPSPGWDSRYDWEGFVEFGDLPVRPRPRRRDHRHRQPGGHGRPAALPHHRLGPRLAGLADRRAAGRPRQGQPGRHEGDPARLAGHLRPGPRPRAARRVPAQHRERARHRGPARVHPLGARAAPRLGRLDARGRRRVRGRGRLLQRGVAQPHRAPLRRRAADRPQGRRWRPVPQRRQGPPQGRQERLVGQQADAEHHRGQERDPAPGARRRPPRADDASSARTRRSGSGASCTG